MIEKFKVNDEIVVVIYVDVGLWVERFILYSLLYV